MNQINISSETLTYCSDVLQLYNQGSQKLILELEHIYGRERHDDKCEME